MNILFIILTTIIIIFMIIIFYGYYLIDYNSHVNFETIKEILYPDVKCAVLLSGQVRNKYEICLLSQVINIIKPLKSDVFFCFDDNLDEKDKMNVIELLNPVDYIWISKDNETKLEPDIDMNVKKMYHKIYLCNEIKKKYEIDNNFKYDLVIKLRPDLIIAEPIPVSIIENINKNTIYYPSINRYDYITSNKIIGITDQMALGDSESMDIYSYAYKYIYPNYINLLKDKKLECPASESMLLYHLKRNKLNTINYYQKFVLYGKRFDADNMFYSLTEFLSKHNSYPLIKCYRQNNK